jgi:hypothetical protein
MGLGAHPRGRPPQPESQWRAVWPHVQAVTVAMESLGQEWSTNVDTHVPKGSTRASHESALVGHPHASSLEQSRLLLHVAPDEALLRDGLVSGLPESSTSSEGGSELFPTAMPPHAVARHARTTTRKSEQKEVMIQIPRCRAPLVRGPASMGLGAAMRNPLMNQWTRAGFRRTWLTPSSLPRAATAVRCDEGRWPPSLRARGT